MRVLTLSVRRSADAHARDSGEEPHDGLTVSAGVDELQAQDSLAALMARADVALYVARSRGRDRVVDLTIPSVPFARSMRDESTLAPFRGATGNPCRNSMRYA
ncbi:hypothetical protein [Paraburkholderia sp. BR14311]|uniref:hypothetical protein n=1 Tax=unclassified Paraburkholderia TaxID=2615204 RepID=UPI0034CDB155